MNSTLGSNPMRKRRFDWFPALATATVAACLGSPPVGAANYSIQTRVFAAGAPQQSGSTTAQRELRATIGQAATSTLVSQRFVLAGGFWHARSTAAPAGIFTDGFEGD